MRLIKLPAMQLQPGMFVAELDRPWLETPFAIQGFMIRNDEEVFFVAEHVDYVYVDADYHGSPMYLPARLMDRKGVSNRINIKSDFQQAKISFESATETLENIFNSVSKGLTADIGAVRQTVRPLIEGVFKNKDAMAALVRLREINDYRYHHGIAMGIWAAILGRHIGLHRSELEKLVVGCAMCDIGLTRIPDEILGSTLPLTDEQREKIGEHTAIGVQMASESEDTDFEIMSIIENHHERFDGSGYPRGIEGATIPLLARIAGLVDTYDAMISPRPYSTGRTSFEASQELIELKGSQFQDVLVEQFIQAIGLFPTGSLVELNTGEVAIVTKQNNQRRLKPEVVVVLNRDKEENKIIELVDLAKQGISDQRWISRELPPGSFNINREDFFL